MCVEKSQNNLKTIIEYEKKNLSSNQKNIKSGVSALSSTSTSFGTAAASARFDAHPNGIDESIKAQALAEEEAAMNQYKVSTFKVKRRARMN